MTIPEVGGIYSNSLGIVKVTKLEEEYVYYIYLEGDYKDYGRFNRHLGNWNFAEVSELIKALL